MIRSFAILIKAASESPYKHHIFNERNISIEFITYLSVEINAQTLFGVFALAFLVWVLTNGRHFLHYINTWLSRKNSLYVYSHDNICNLYLLCTIRFVHITYGILLTGTHRIYETIISNVRNTKCGSIDLTRKRFTSCWIK